MKLRIIDHNTYMGHVSIRPILKWVPQILRQIMRMQEGFRGYGELLKTNSLFGGGRWEGRGGGENIHQRKLVHYNHPLQLMLRKSINKLFWLSTGGFWMVIVSMAKQQRKIAT